MTGTYTKTTHLIYIPENMFKSTVFDHKGIKNIDSPTEKPYYLPFFGKKI